MVQNESDKKLLDKIKEIVEKNIENPDFNIEQLASEVCMGRSAFFEKIKDITGTTPANFILECRLNKATALLIKNPTLRMDDIAAYLALVQDAIFVNALRIILEFLRYNIGNKTRDSLKRLIHRTLKIGTHIFWDTLFGHFGTVIEKRYFYFAFAKNRFSHYN